LSFAIKCPKTRECNVVWRKRRHQERASKDGFLNTVDLKKDNAKVPRPEIKNLWGNRQSGSKDRMIKASFPGIEHGRQEAKT